MISQRVLFWSLFIIIPNLGLEAQTHLESEKLQPCEIFQKKQQFDRQERLDFIKTNVGKNVTVFIVKRKSNKIKRRYTGKIMAIDNTLPLDAQVDVLAIQTQENNQTNFQFPLTNHKKYRIYRTECLKDNIH